MWLSEKDVIAAEQAHPLLGALFRSGGGGQHRLFIDPHLKGLATGPDGREVLFRFRGETELTEGGIWFHFELEDHPDVASLEGELIPSSPHRKPRGFVQVTPVADSEQTAKQPKLLEW
ncbi:hypothetical protein G4Y73_12480 [Wenzhouxiangella sp. XN201]|uniref:hypothetical protein n=1 Tax=Wenzhouxiangella sp. XN201 TaxID=2710755 RepID=UPI0013C7E52C|nr:hypothetical protein [Wenzhouxiangella sp. XN201]NEZ04966.1 hypothetical protein [Wenzhouxiangella sp. XN201]